MHAQKKWCSIIAPALEDTPFELVGVECLGGRKQTVVRVYIDKQGGITIDDIAKLSRQISVILDAEGPIQGSYTLEVSSPGLDRPLFKPLHFKQQIGHKIAVKTSLNVGKRQNFRGILIDADEEKIQMGVENEVFTFSYEDIEKAKVIPDIKIGSGRGK